MLKNVLTRLFNYDLNQVSPVCVDMVQIEKRDEDGNIFTVYEKFDYAKFQASLGSAKDWSLGSLLRAGINPEFPIHTGNTTRLAAAADMPSWNSEADAILSEGSDSNK